MNKRQKVALTALGVVSTISISAGDQRTKVQTVENELLALNRQVADMQVRHDIETAKRLLAEEYLFAQADGQVTNKKQNVDVIGSADFVCDELTTSDVTVRVYGATALIMGVVKMRARYAGQDVGGRFRYMDVWVKRSGKWQNVASQATRLSD